MTDDLISPEDTAEILGIPLSALRRRMQDGELPERPTRSEVLALRAKDDVEEAALFEFGATTDALTSAARRRIPR